MLHRPPILHTLTLLLIAASSLLVSAQSAEGNGSVSHPLELAAVATVIDCAALKSSDISGTIGASAKILSADVVDDGKAAAYCKVKVSIEDFISFEVHLPTANWSQRLLFSGNNYQPPAGMGAWAVTSWSDLGHRSHEEVFASNYEYRVDYGYRSMHLIVVSSKALIGKYYNRPPKFTYYAGCSEPAREGMVDLERYPDDYDGVVAGCAPMPMTVNNGIYNTWNMVLNARPDGSSILTNDKLPLIHQAVLDQCDAADGLKDGLISEPFNCHPDLSVVQCRAGQDPSTCLTADQVRVTMEVYRSAHDGKGAQLVPQGPLPGSEFAWAGLIAGGTAIAANYEEARVGTAKAVRDLYSDPPLPDTFQLSDIKFDRATFDALTKLHYIYDGTDPDLSAFAKAGHKLLLWHGLADVMVPVAYSLNYYAALERTMGSKALDSFLRFYLFPGVYHCGGGQGPSTRDFLVPLTYWVEQGIAPGAIMAVHRPERPDNFGPGSMQETGPPPPPDRTRPVYPYPYTAKYIGAGDINDAANFVQGPQMKVPSNIYNWLGTTLYKPDYEKLCTGSGTTLDCKSAR
jgi:feruloyl esterase